MGRVLEISRARGLGCSGVSARLFPLGCSCFIMSFASAARDSSFMDLSAAHKILTSSENVEIKHHCTHKLAVICVQ